MPSLAWCISCGCCCFESRVSAHHTDWKHIFLCAILIAMHHLIPVLTSGWKNLDTYVSARHTFKAGILFGECLNVYICMWASLCSVAALCLMFWVVWFKSILLAFLLCPLGLALRSRWLDDKGELFVNQKHQGMGFYRKQSSLNTELLLYSV